ncbi:unnamed protein product [Candidula unifasciata]|uniref:BTB domain-containing protein n=1 Tax=Candidula unifasciata TaxID=100452 RepID=A0A8S3YIG2_9EUPU|nr:unnamed protein product [Candidula unifasciata]
MAVSDCMARAVVQAMAEQLERSKFYDITIVVKQRHFHCHRFQLSACSEYFRRKFSSGMKESHADIVDIKEIEPDIFSLVIDCIYKAKYVLNTENATRLWHAANWLEIDFLIESCETFHTNNLSIHNCVDVYLNAKVLKSDMVMRLSWELIVKEFEYLRQTEKILMLDYEDIMKLLEIDALSVPSEDVMIDVIMRWTRFSWGPTTVTVEEDCSGATAETPPPYTELVGFVSSNDSRSEKRKKQIVEDIQGQNNINALEEQYVAENEDIQKEANPRAQFLPSLLSAAKICLVSLTRIQTLFESELIRENRKAFDVVMEGLRYQTQPGRRHDYCPPIAIHRSSSELKNVIMSMFVQADQVKMSCMTLENEWFTLAAPPAHLAQCKAVSYENDIYALPTTAYQYAFKYDSKTNTWRQLEAPINTARPNISIVVLDQYIYAIGGDNCTAIERFSAADEQKAPGTGKWETVGQLRHAVTNIAMTTSESNIFVLGIASEDSSSIIVQRFDTQTMSTFINLHEMPGSSKNMIVFRQEKRSYLLQETGALWKTVVSDERVLSLHFQGMVWENPVELESAIICNNELLVFVKTADPQLPREWDTTRYPEFKHVKIVDREINCVLNNVVPKTHLTAKEA